MALSTRPLIADDLDFLWDMCAVAAHVPDGSAARSNAGLARYAAGWGRPHDVAFVATDGDTNQRAGAIWMRRFPASDPGYGYFDEHTPELGLGVVAAYRGAGVGRLLVGALIEFAESRYPGLTLSVFDWNDAAIRLYRSVGFVTFAEYPNSGGTLSLKMRLVFAGSDPGLAL